MKQDAFDEIFKEVNRVLVIMPHPDDTDLYCGGTIARLVASGKDVMCIKLTNGGKGTKQSEVTEAKLTKIRKEEDAKSALALGIKPDQNIQLGIPDGEVEESLANIEKLALYFRKFRPDILITCNPEHVFIRFDEGENWVNHRDHRNTAKLAIDAAYPYSRDTAFFPHQLKQAAEYQPTKVFLLADYYDHPDLVYVDITDQVDKKSSAWKCHKSAYTPEAVEDAIEFLNKDQDSGRYYETFRLVTAD